MAESQSTSGPPTLNSNGNAFTAPTTSTSTLPPSQVAANVVNATGSQPWSQSPVFPPRNGPPQSMPQYSASTAEILKRLSANASSHSGSAGWEAAREQVLQKMVTSDKLPTPPSIPNSGRRGGRGGRTGTPSGLKSEVLGSSVTPMASTPASGRGRGSGRGRARGGRRGGKRKRAESEDETSEDDSDISSSYTPLPTRTKSGRNVNKPVTFVPTLPSPPSKKRKPTKSQAEAALCKVCRRGTSPTNNMIVFCDSCNIAYHQYCHVPAIDKDVTQIIDKEWFCIECTRAKESAVEGMDGLVAGEDLSLEERRSYLSTLPASTLVSLLLHSTVIHPNLPIFAPNTKSIIENIGTSAPTTTISNPGLHVPATQATPPQPTNTAHNGTEPPTSSTTPRSQNVPTDSSDIDPAEAQLYAEFRSHRQSDAPVAKIPHMTPAPSTTVAPPKLGIGESEQQEPQLEEYDGYDTDPPAHYPKAGNGLARTLRPESEDIQWLVDDNFEVFSHNYKGDGTGIGPDAPHAGQDLNGFSVAAGGFGNGSAGMAHPIP